MIRRYRDGLRARLWRWAERPRLARHRSALADILPQHPARPVIVFPPGLSWQTALFQRPQQLARALARRGAAVFYLEPEHWRMPAGFWPEEAGLYRCHVPIETFDALDRLWVYALTWNWKFVERFRAGRILYDVVDCLDAFQGDRRTLQAAHERLARRAERVLATSLGLQRWVSALRPDVQLCPNGVDYAHFAAAQQPGACPADLAACLSPGSALIGYHGALARWFDFDLLAAVARLRPELAFVLIGPDHDGSLAASGLLSLPNLHWLGSKPYEALPAYVRQFAVGVIPFRLNDITHAVSPLKLFELMAAGKPVVITPMEESLRYEGLLAASDAEGFAQQLDRALALKDDPAHRALLDRQARQNTWDARAQQILESLSP